MRSYLKGLAVAAAIAFIAVSSSGAQGGRPSGQKGGQTGRPTGQQTGKQPGQRAGQQPGQKTGQQPGQKAGQQPGQGDQSAVDQQGQSQGQGQGASADRMQRIRERARHMYQQASQQMGENEQGGEVEEPGQGDQPGQGDEPGQGDQPGQGDNAGQGDEAESATGTGRSEVSVRQVRDLSDAIAKSAESLSQAAGRARDLRSDKTLSTSSDQRRDLDAMEKSLNATADQLDAALSSLEKVWGRLQTTKPTGR